MSRITMQKSGYLGSTGIGTLPSSTASSYNEKTVRIRRMVVVAAKEGFRSAGLRKSSKLSPISSRMFRLLATKLCAFDQCA